MRYSELDAMSPLEFVKQPAEDLFRKLILKGNGGVHVQTTAAPALSTQFVKSNHTAKAKAGVEGAFAEIIYPPLPEIANKLSSKHGRDDLHGYITTAHSDVFPAGYGERSAKALAKEETTYQLKGTFPSAMMSFTKLRARVEAREGDVSSLDSMFTQMWGLPDGSSQLLPSLHMTGSEPTRMSAMEDRAYHALSGHPSATGGFRVDTATLAPDALGTNVPLNWPRLRTGLKAIATVQLQGDIEIAAGIRHGTREEDFCFRMDIVMNSQPRYSRARSWEGVMERVLSYKPELLNRSVPKPVYPGVAISMSMIDCFFQQVADNPNNQMREQVQAIARTVSRASSDALVKTINILTTQDRDRAQLIDLDGDGLTELEKSRLSESFVAPRYKVVRSTLYRGLQREQLGRDKLPDISSHGRSRLMLDLAELREAHLMMPLDLAGVLNMAVYLATMRESVRPKAYELMILLSDELKKSESSGPVSKRLRIPSLYHKPRIRALGPYLFGHEFVGLMELLLRNMPDHLQLDSLEIKSKLWSYLAGRCDNYGKCPVLGDWRDLITYMHEAPEGWSLYYWVRMTIGKQHHAVSAGILAPISAGIAVDTLTLCKAGVKERARRWRDYYTAKYKTIETSLDIERQERIRREKPPDRLYVPPHVRKLVDLELQYDAEEILNRSGGYTATQYQLMVEMQSKAKFFSQIEVFTVDRRIVAGITDENLRLMFVEFYQARWYSLHKRIEHAVLQGKTFWLGPHEFEVHPWGDLQTEFPPTTEELVAFMESLDSRAWTIPPTYLYEKLKKAIEELWSDINNEIATLDEYIREVHDGLAESQEISDSHARDMVHAAALVEAIPIPTTGYRPPYQLPTRSIVVQQEQNPVIIETRADTFLQEPSEDELLDLDEMEMAGCDLLECEMADTSQLDLGDGSLSLAPQARCLTYMEIWHHLGLAPDIPPRMRLAYGLSSDQDLNAEHMDSVIGPVLLVGEESKVVRSWASHKGMMLSRLNQAAPAIFEADM